jgi:phosphoribosylformimino-5-aminoimidazole carboxamide ribotide isomerase
MIFPAIDLMDGGCVRLIKGDFTKRTNYGVSPLETAKAFAKAGAEWIHIVDLDGAKTGSAEQAELIIQIAQESGLKVQTGGGIREISQIRRLLDGGISRVVIGSLAVSNPQMVKFWIQEFGPERVIIALDVNEGKDGRYYPATRGWTETASRSLNEVITDYIGSGLKTVLVTDIERDGVQIGSNTALYQRLQNEYPTLQLITSGGVGTLEHVKALKALRPHGIIIGKALYEGNFTLKDAIDISA